MSEMSVTKLEYQELIEKIDQALARFGSRPPMGGVEEKMYEEVRRVRETLLRALRDLRDKNIPRDSKSPLESI